MTDQTFDTLFVRNGELIIFVTPGSLDGFVEQVTGVPLTASIDYVVGPAVPPAVGTGSVRFSIGTNGNGTAALRNSLYDLLPLADLAVLRYSTYVSAFGLGGQAPYLLLDVNFGVGTTVDEQLFFEPLYQDGTYPGDPVPDQGTLALNTWQTWDAIIGGWHTGGGPPLITLANYIALHPAARIVNSPGGGLQIAAGGAAPAWNNFVGNVNPLLIGDTDTCIIYDFGPTAGPDGCR
ncbi:MAG TPA: hypothetical protein VN521_07400 [Negativicutes bacterium]|nr:hypothetical protein [Negativicutes bacterium]